MTHVRVVGCTGDRRQKPSILARRDDGRELGMYLEGHDVSEQEQVPPIDGDPVGLHDVRDLFRDDDPSRLHSQRLEHLAEGRRNSQPLSCCT